MKQQSRKAVITYRRALISKHLVQQLIEHEVAKLTELEKAELKARFETKH